MTQPTTRRVEPWGGAWVPHDGAMATHMEGCIMCMVGAKELQMDHIELHEVQVQGFLKGVSCCLIEPMVLF